MRQRLFVSIIILGILTLTTATGHAYSDGTLGTNCSMCHGSQRPANNPPEADAGLDQTVAIGDTVLLDGSGSSDADGDPLTYQWSLATVPTGSSASLSDPASVNPTFVADVSGEYIVELVVNDGTADSSLAVATIITENAPPAAVINVEQPVLTGDTVSLDGSGSSDADGNPLTYQWSLAAMPFESSASLTDPTSVNSTFMADVAGDYIVNLIVNDGQQNSAEDSVVLTVSLAGDPSPTDPTAPSAGDPPAAEPPDSDDGESQADGDDSLETDDNESEKSRQNENTPRKRRKYRRRYYRGPGSEIQADHIRDRVRNRDS